MVRVLFALLVTLIPALAEDPLRVSFVSEHQRIAPGKTFSVGLFQQIKKGYHTYWRTPGTVGMSMSVQWKLPPGFQAGEIQWPTPELGRMAAYDVWGYHDEAFLVVDITPPADLKPGSEIRLEGTAIWMCCGKSCFPGNQTISLTLPVANSSAIDPRWRKRFAQTRADQPVKSPAWRLDCRFTKGQYRLTVAPADGRTGLPKNIRFFDYDRQVSSAKGQRVKRQRRRAVIRLHEEEHTGEQLERLRGILVADTEWQPGAKVIAVDVPIARQ